VYREVVRVFLVVGLIGCGFAPAPATNPLDDASSHGDAAATDAKQFFDAMHDGPCGDDDNDGVCNAVDTWPCGPLPASLGTQLAMTANGGQTSFTLTAIDVAAQSRLVVAAPNTTLSVHLHYAITDSACSQSCVDQLEIGWAAPGNRTSCPFDDTVPDPGGVTGTITTATIKAPATPGVYDIRANIGQNFSCTYQGASTWWGTAPGTSRTLAKVCVH
jgi:hypothetical protein